MLWIAGLGLVLNLGWHFFWPATSVALPAALLVAACGSAWFVSGPRAVAAIVPLAWAAASGGGVLADRLTPALDGRDAAISGTICSLPRRSGRAWRFVLESSPMARREGFPRRLYLAWYADSEPPHPGELWMLKVRLRRPRGSLNPGGFDFERWAFSRGIGATGYVRSSALNQRVAARAGCRLHAVRYRLARRLEQLLEGSPASAHVTALAVGVRDGLSRSDWDLMRDTGTVHLLAISGLHIGLVAGGGWLIGLGCGGLVAWAGWRCSPQAIARVAAACTALVYSAMAGFAVPTVRALVMLSVITLLGALRRSWPSLWVLAAALYAVLLIEPRAPVTPGFWLSFAAVAALLLSALQNRPDAGPLRRALLAQAVVSVALAPLAVAFFGRVSWLAPAINLIVIPVFAIIVVPAVLLGTLSLTAGAEVGAVLLRFAAATIAGTMTALQAITNHLGAVWSPTIATTVSLLGAAALALVLIWPRPLPARWICAAITASVMIFGASSRDRQGMRVVVLDVGHGLAVLVMLPDYTLLYDSGPDFGARDAGESIVIPALRSHGVSHLDAVVLSHADSDHRGGLDSVLAQYDAALVGPDEVKSPDSRKTTTCRAGLSWTGGGARFDILSPHAHAAFVSRNDRSCVLRVEFRGFVMILPGDIERAAETALVARGSDLRAELLVAPHHGSRTSSTLAFARAVAPDLLIYSTGLSNRWGFPDAGVVARWWTVSRCQLSTAYSGAVTIDIDGDGMPVGIIEQRKRAARVWTASPGGDLPCAQQGR